MYPAMDIVRPLLPECHGSEIIFDWFGNFKEQGTKRGNRWFGSNILHATAYSNPKRPLGRMSTYNNQRERLRRKNGSLNVSE